MEIPEIRDEALRKIGRNVVKFQKIEAILKLLVVGREFKGPVRKAKSILKEKRSQIERNSMGKLLEDYMKVYSATSEDFHEYPEDRDEPWASYTLKLENEEGTIPQQKRALSFLEAIS